MDSDLKTQWGCLRQPQQQQEYASEEQHQQPPAKLPKLNALTTTNNNNEEEEEEEDHPLPSSSSAGSTLPLFVPDHPTQPQSHPHQHPPTKPHPSPRIWSYFSTAQWQELELQALIYRYMLSGATVPPELLHPIKKSLPHQPTSFCHDDHHQSHLQCYLHYPQPQPQPQPIRFQAGYWGSASMDPEPGRCRRTDGKKWRCSRDVVPGQKYCERHVHRGRNRSRKPVEIAPTSRPTGPAANGNVGWGHPKTNPNSVTVAALGNVTTASPLVGWGPSDHSSIDLFQMNNRSHSGPPPEVMAHSNSSGVQVLRHFFDDWPRPLHEPDVASSTGLSMSTARNSSSDVSLKLSTGDTEQGGAAADGTPERERAQGSNWLAGWLPNRVASMGGPLAEALRPSATTSHSLPMSVLHQLTCGMASETSLVTQV